jgi:hypothetical protein
MLSRLTEKFIAGAENVALLCKFLRFCVSYYTYYRCKLIASKLI